MHESLADAVSHLATNYVSLNTCFEHFDDGTGNDNDDDGTRQSAKLGRVSIQFLLLFRHRILQASFSTVLASNSYMSLLSSIQSLMLVS
jgi:hypothetical protein